MAAFLGMAIVLLLLFEAYVQTAKAGSIPDVARNAGFSGVDLAIAVAVAYAESSGNPQAVGDNGDSIGLWQINLPAHPQYTKDQLFDPQTNANAAFAVYQAAGGSFSPWTTFKTGAYLSDQYQNLPDVQSVQVADNSGDSNGPDNFDDSGDDEAA